MPHVAGLNVFLEVAVAQYLAVYSCYPSRRGKQRRPGLEARNRIVHQQLRKQSTEGIVAVMPCATNAEVRWILLLILHHCQSPPSWPRRYLLRPVVEYMHHLIHSKPQAKGYRPRDPRLFRPDFWAVSFGPGAASGF